MHLTESHMYAFNRITHVCIKQNHTCMYLTQSHMHALNRITHVCIKQNQTYVFDRIPHACI